MNKKTITFIIILAFVVLMGAATFVYTRLSQSYQPDTSIDEPGQTGSSIGQIAPDFTVYDAAGNAVKLSDFRGSPVVLNFWASWCPPCRSEMDSFNQVYEQNKNQVNFLMVDLVDGQRETQEDGLRYITQQNYSFPFYADLDQNGALEMGISSIPTTYFINAEGVIVSGYQGTLNEEILVEEIETLLNP